MNLFFYIIFIFFCVFQGINSRRRIWTCNTNGDNPENWLGGTYTKNCKGFYFPAYFKEICLTSLQKLTTNAIYFPIQGDVELREDTEIVFSENSDTCVKVRDDIKMRNMADPECWENDNEATPDANRVPCIGDNITLPSNATFNIKQSPFKLNARIISHKGKATNFISLYRLYRNPDGCSEFIVDNWFDILDDYSRRNAPLLNYCRKNAETDFICNIRTNWRRIICSNPISVVGHCTGFCGSVMHLLVEEKFDIKNFFEKVKIDENVDFYYTLIEATPKTYQITMTDKKNFTGDSIDYARKFYDSIASDLKTWHISQIHANYSGYPINTGNTFGVAMGIVFGTFIFVVLIFALLYAVYIGPLRDVNIKIPNIPRLPRSRKTSATTRKQFVFARFENKDDGAMSMAGSIVSLDKAFDNPMYEQQMASTSTAPIMETVEEAEEIKEITVKPTSQSTFANPLYDIDTTLMDLSEE